MKKILLSILLCSSISLCFAQDGSIGAEKDIERLVNIGLEVAQDREVQKAVIQLHQAYLHLLEVTLQQIAGKFGSEEKALVQVGLNYLAELAKDPVWRSIVSQGDPDDINDEMKKQLQVKVAPIIVVAQAYVPILQKIIQKKVMVTKNRTFMNEDGKTYFYSTTQPKPEYAEPCLYFILDRIIEALELAQKSVQ
jgi:hypothetical protein